MENFSELIKNRRSMRKFTDEELTQDEVVALMKAALMSPSSKRSNSWQFIVVDDKEILKIDLNTNKEYTVKGYLGDVVLEVKNKKIRVKEETSDKHICSKEGYIYTNNKSLVCMPNKIIVKIISEDNDLDGVVY